jgi:hypothetical protein
MTVSTETLSKAVTAASVVAGTPIDFNGNVFGTDDLAVYYNGDQLATYSTDYTVTLASDFTSAQVTPTATLVAKLNGTDDLLIRRDIALLQPTNLPINSKFPETSLERFMDKVIALFQQVEDKFQRSLLTSAGEANRNLQLPVATEGRALVWAADGSLENSDSDLSDIDAAVVAVNSARDAVLAAYDDFDDRYLGEKASEPSVDNDGDPLQAGALYFDTTLGEMRVYTGAAWVAPAAELGSGLAAINALTPAADRLPYYTGTASAALATFTAAGRAMVAAASASAQAAILAPFIPSVPTGTRTGYVGFSAPSGWVLANGLTIGSASSNATNRANADTEALFTLLWNNYANTELPIVDSAGSPSTRGANAAADYAADKAIPVPDYAGRVGTGRDNMRGSSIGRVVSSQKHGIDGNTLGKSGGASEHALSEAELPDHVHEAQPFTDWAAGGSARFGVNSSTYNRNTGGVYLNTQGTGGDEAHTNMQPSIIETVIIKL